jgi:hypothetical protein
LLAVHAVILLVEAAESTSYLLMPDIRVFHLTGWVEHWKVFDAVI